MSDKPIPYRKFSIQFTVLNFLILAPLFFTFIYQPSIVGIQALSFSLESDPIETWFTLGLGCVVFISVVLFLFKMYKAAFYLAAFPVFLLLFSIIGGLMVGLFSSMLS